ncbi:MAG: hypothetical protein ACU84Q_19575 [Gammaproteobacteria bacterium]
MNKLQFKIVNSFLLALLAFATVNTCHGQSPIVQLDITQPRAYGYYLGDKFQRVINLTIAEPYKLDQKSLPKAAFLQPWFSIETPKVKKSDVHEGTNYLITLTYQIVNIDRDNLNMGVAHHNVEIEGNGERFNFLIPATRISAAMITAGSGNELQPSARPPLATISLKNLAVYAVILAASLIGLYWLTFGFSLRGSRPPFTRAYQRLKRQSPDRWDEQKYHDALRAIHGAFNEVAGKTLFIDDIDTFLKENPNFEPLGANITTFFKHTRQYFFSNADAPAHELSAPEILDLLAACSRAERQV